MLLTKEILPIPRHQRVRVEVRPGEGGEDAALFANELTVAFCAYARRLGASV